MTKAKKPAAPKPEDDGQAHVTVESTKGMTNDREKKLLDEIAALQAQVSEQAGRLTEAEQAARDAAEAQGMLMQREMREIPTGKRVTVKRCKGYKVVGHKEDGSDILRPEWKDVSLPTFFYRIDLPPSGGLDIKINGTPLYHGALYTFDEDTLRSVKDIVYRCWKHDADIMGSNENAYRAKQSPVLRGGVNA